jgi:hypothetical protein
MYTLYHVIHPTFFIIIMDASSNTISFNLDTLQTLECNNCSRLAPLYNGDIHQDIQLRNKSSDSIFSNTLISSPLS